MPDGKAVATVTIEERTDRWRFRCPNGHTTWEPTTHHVWCHTCARMDRTDGVSSNSETSAAIDCSPAIG